MNNKTDVSDKTIVIFNAAPCCVDKDTEYLTKTGWKKISEYSEGDEIAVCDINGNTIFEKPLEYIREPFDGDFLVFKRPTFEMKLTANHKVIYVDDYGNRKTTEWVNLFTKVEQNSYGLGKFIPKTFNLTENIPNPSLDLLFLKVAIMADSSLLKNGVQFNLKKLRKIERLRYLLDRLGVEYKEYVFPSMEGYVRFVVKTDMDKSTDWSWINFNLETKQLLLSEFLFWDGDGIERFFSGKKEEVDFVQTLAASCDKDSSIISDIREGRNTTYSLHIAKRNMQTMTRRPYNKPTKTEKSEDGFCYCFTTSTGFWVARKSDSIFLTGNSGKDASVDMIHSYFQSGVKLAFKDELYEDTAKHFNVRVEDLIDYHSDRSLKEKPSLMFPKYGNDSIKQYLYALLYVIGVLINNHYLMSLGYYSSRQALIFVSEHLIKPTKGNGYYGSKLAEKIENSKSKFFFVSDSGYKEELTPLLENGYNVYIVHLERLGATFEGDSRTLLTENDFKGEDGSMKYKNLKFIKMDNNGSLDDLYKTITDFSFDLVLNQTLDHYGGYTENVYEVIYT